MILKLGLLLFLLFLNVAAEQRPRTVPTASLVSAIQQVPHLRRDLFRADHSPVHGLLSSSFHLSLQSTRATCAWDTKRRECSISISSMKHLLEESKTEYAKMLVERLRCVEKLNKKDCNKGRSCLWIKELDKCAFADMRKHHKDSPCAKTAPLYFNLAEASTQCSKQDSSEGCERKRKCRWTSRAGVCRADEYFIYYGIKNFANKVAQINGMVRATLQREYSALQSAENFTWRSLLAFKPCIKCPSDIEQLVCDYVVALWSGIMGPQLYCFGRYELVASDCEADPLCVWSTDSGECENDDYLAALSAGLSARKVLTDSLTGGIDKRIVEAMYECTSITEPRRCKGTCIWNPINYSCKPRKGHVADLLTEHGKHSMDALCAYLDVDGSSQCYTRPLKHKCEKSEFCHWNSASGCEPVEEFYFSAAVDRDPLLKRRYQTFKKRCSKYTTTEACEELNDLTSRIEFTT